MSTASSKLASLSPHLDALVSRAARERAALVMNEVLPLVHPWGFEVRLAAADERVDFGGAIAVAGVAHGQLARLGEDDAELGRLATHPAWRALRRFALRWDDPGGRLAEYVPFIGLEFDVADEPRAVPEPSVFAMLDWPIEGDPAPAAAPAARQGQAAAQEALRVLLDDAYPAAVAARVDQCFQVLPRDARVISVAAMLGRSVSGVRVFASVPPADLERYLAELGWPGDTGAVMRVAAEHRRHLTSGVVQFQVDVGSQVGERLGMEFSFMRQADAGARWRALLDQLVAEGLCCATKRAALLAWPGRSPHPGEDGGDESLARDISHVKISLHGGVPVEAKAYLSVESKPGA